MKYVPILYVALKAQKDCLTARKFSMCTAVQHEIVLQTKTKADFKFLCPITCLPSLAIMIQMHCTVLVVQ